MTAVLEAILEDLQTGLRRRATRRRRARRAGATILSSAVLLAFGLSAAGMVARPSAAPAAGGGAIAVRLIHGETCAISPCWEAASHVNIAKEHMITPQ